MSLAAEQAYFDGNHCKHVADYYENERLKRKFKQNQMQERLLVRI